MPNNTYAKDTLAFGMMEYTWFLWEESCPPPKHGFYGVIMADGNELAALFDKGGTWWSGKMKKIVPIFWRDSSNLHR